MRGKVAIVRSGNGIEAALREALSLIGGINDLNNGRNMTVKVGIFDPRSRHHSSPELVGAIAGAFDQAPSVLLAESDSYCGKALDRLAIYDTLYSERIQPHSLSDDADMRPVKVAGDVEAISGALFKPNVLVSTHVLRTFARGSILKNLFGCTPVVQKAKFHKSEVFANQLADIAEAAGGIDLAVMDGTYLYHSASEKCVRLDLLIVGRDAVAVEVVGCLIAGLKPENNPTIQEFAKRGLGEADPAKIEIVGIAPEELDAFKAARKELKKLVDSAPRGEGISDTIDCLTEEGWLDAFRTAEEVAAELQQRGVNNATKTMTETTLKRRVGKTLERAQEEGAVRGGWRYRRAQG